MDDVLSRYYKKYMDSLKEHGIDLSEFVASISTSSEGKPYFIATNKSLVV